MAHLPQSPELARRIEHAEIDYMTDRMKAVQEREGNPMGVEIQTFGRAVAFCSRHMPWPQFNTVKGMGREEIGFIPDMLHFYREHKCKLQIELIPAPDSKEVMKALAANGLVQSDFHASLYGAPEHTIMGNHPPDIRIRELTTEEIGLYAQIHCLGTGLPVSGIGPVAANNEVLIGRAGWRFYLGLIQDQPAGVGVMYIRDGAASLTFAATLPEYRKQGVHQALLRHRLMVAGRQGCTLAVGQAAYASTSHRNMERSGLRLAYTRAAWTERE